MEERILTLHPEGKKGVNISRAKYETVKDSILQILQGKGEMTFEELGRGVEGRIGGNFEGSVSWYFTTVKLDLEARGIVSRVPESRPQSARLTERG